MSIVTPESLHAQIEALKQDNERLTRALDQCIEHAPLTLPFNFEVKTKHGVMFRNPLDSTVWYRRECPELAAYLRAKEGK